jgi:hypothetical protein
MFMIVVMSVGRKKEEERERERKRNTSYECGEERVLA